MLGNNEHFYSSQDDKDGEDEEEEEDQGREARSDEGRRSRENGGVEGLGVKEMIGGRLSWEGKGGEAVKPAAMMVGRQRVDRALRPGNLDNQGIPHVSNQAQLHHHGANKLQQQQHLVAAKRRALMERSMTTMAPQEDSFLTMMVFRVGIPDIKQTVGGSEPLAQHTCFHSCLKNAAGPNQQITKTEV